MPAVDFGDTSGVVQRTLQLLSTIGQSGVPISPYSVGQQTTGLGNLGQLMSQFGDFGGSGASIDLSPPSSQGGQQPDFSSFFSTLLSGLRDQSSQSAPAQQTQVQPQQQQQQQAQQTQQQQQQTHYIQGVPYSSDYAGGVPGKGQSGGLTFSRIDPFVDSSHYLGTNPGQAGGTWGWGTGSSLSVW